MTIKSRKYILISLIISFLFSCLLVFYNRKNDKDIVLNVYNWGEFISNGENGTIDVNCLFTKRTGIKINYTLFQTNEEMLAKVLGGGADYDIVCPSDYAVARLIKENALHKIDFNNIPNYKFIDDGLKNLDFDPNNEYSVPYLWGLVGIFYNKKFVDEKELNWDIFWNPKYSKKMLMFDNPRDAFAVSMIKNKKSINSHNNEEWMEAFHELEKQRPLIQNYVSDQIYDKLIGEEAYLAPYYYGYCIPETLKINKNICISVPKEGTNKFVDSMCILKTSKHKKEAEQYINFLCEYDISLANARKVGNISPHKEVMKALSEGSEGIFESYDLKKAVAFNDLPSDISRMNDNLWLKIKMGENTSLVYNLILILIFSLLIIWNIFVFLKSRKFKFWEWYK